MANSWLRGRGDGGSGGRYAHGSYSLANLLGAPQYRDAVQAVYTIIREEGVGALYRGVTLTALRQAMNQGECCVSCPEGSWFLDLTDWKRHEFTAYQELKRFAKYLQPGLDELPSYHHMMIEIVSGAMDPFSNAPIDTIKTRMYPYPVSLLKLKFLLLGRVAEIHFGPGQSSFDRIKSIARDMWRWEGLRVVSQGYHAARVESCARAGNRV